MHNLAQPHEYVRSPEAQIAVAIPLSPPDPRGPIYEGATSMTRGRSANMLAGYYGYSGVETLAEALPSHARVLDVGAAASPLGIAVAALRPDVEWLNVDIAYPEDTKAIQKIPDMPPNIKFLRADILDLPRVLEPGSFDRVFSYGLLRHMSLAGRETGLTSVENLLRMAKPSGGEVAAGPSLGRKDIAGIRRVKASTVSAAHDQEDFHRKAEWLMEATKTPPLQAAIRRLLYRLRTGTTPDM